MTTTFIVLIAVGCVSAIALAFVTGRYFPYGSRLDSEYEAGRNDEYHRLTQSLTAEGESEEDLALETAELRAEAFATRAFGEGLPLPPPPVPAAAVAAEEELGPEDEIIEATTWFEALSDDQDEPITPPPSPSNVVQAVQVSRHSDDPHNDCTACTSSKGKCTCDADCGALMCCGWAEQDMKPVPRYVPLDPDSLEYEFMEESGGGGNSEHTALTDILSWGARMQAEIDAWKYEDWATDVPAISAGSARAELPQLVR